MQREIYIVKLKSWKCEPPPFHLDPFPFIFMQFSEKLAKQSISAPPPMPLGLAPPVGHPGSAPEMRR